MQEIKKRRIVLASVLKPVSETRMFEKLGQTLAGAYDVHIIGTASREKEVFPSIHYHSLTPFKRLSLSRILAPFRIVKMILQLKPDALIICTHELVFAALLVKVLTGSRIIYDVQENYSRNILHTKTFPLLARPLLALYVRTKEWIVSPFVDFYFLAEASYQQELAFTGRKKIVLENKLKRPTHVILPRKSQHDGKIHFLFSGTLAESTGVFIAIDVVSRLNLSDPDVQLLIIGYCSLPQTRLRLEQRVSTLPFVKLVTGDIPIPHHQILSAIQRADVGIISYPPNPSTAAAVPTKLYEYLGYQLPILLIDHAPWRELCARYDAAITFNPSALEPEEVVDTFRSKRFYSTAPDDVFWDSEALKLKQTFHNLLKDTK